MILLTLIFTVRVAPLAPLTLILYVAASIGPFVVDASYFNLPPSSDALPLPGWVIISVIDAPSPARSSVPMIM